MLDRCFSFLQLPTIEISTEIRNNQTANSARVELRSLAKVAVRCVPQVVRKAIKKIPLTTVIWRATTRITTSAKPPTISAEDRSLIEAILADEIIYYNALKAKHSPI